MDNTPFSITQQTAMLETIKSRIESMDKTHHIEILKLLKKYPQIKLNENKSGVYINLTFLPKETIDDLQSYLEYINDQESCLMSMEYQKAEFKNAFFVDGKKEDKEEAIYMAST
jgi:hypothetical protein